MPTRIDLHLHSDFSDGRQSATEVVKLAAASGVQILAMADHESTQSLPEVRAAAKKASVEIVPAVEITTSYRGSVLHMVGYNFDPRNKLMQQLATVLLKNRADKVTERMTHLSKVLSGPKKLNIKDFTSSQKGFFNRWKAADYLVDRGLVKTRQEALRHLVGIKIAVPDFSPAAAVQLVHQAGGKAFLAHPFGPKISLSFFTKDSQEQMAVMTELVEQGLDGIECYTPSHEPLDIKRALSMAKKFGLAISAGSDWHGPLALTGKGILDFIPNYVKAPGQFAVPEEVQKQMAKYFLG